MNACSPHLVKVHLLSRPGKSYLHKIHRDTLRNTPEVQARITSQQVIRSLYRQVVAIDWLQAAACGAGCFTGAAEPEFLAFPSDRRWKNGAKRRFETTAAAVIGKNKHLLIFIDRFCKKNHIL